MNEQRKPREPEKRAAKGQERKPRRPEEPVKDLPVSQEQAESVKGGKAIIGNIPR